MQSDQIDQLAGALVKAQAELPHPKKDKTATVKGKSQKTGEAYSYDYNYADLSVCVETARPVLAKHKLAVAQFPSINGTQFALRTILLHESGQFIAGDYPLHDLTPQETGSEITYARRYAYCAVLGLVADDDDDGAAGQRGAGGQEGAKGVECPACGERTIIRGKPEFGGGYLCWKNKGGCGKKWEGLESWPPPCKYDAALAFIEETDDLTKLTAALKNVEQYRKNGNLSPQQAADLTKLITAKTSKEPDQSVSA